MSTRTDTSFPDTRRFRSFNMAASVVVAALLACALARAVLRRLQVLTGGIHKLAAGDYTTRIANKTDDELGRLAQDLNRLANVLERTEQSRRDFMADISHELRTDRKSTRLNSSH